MNYLAVLLSISLIVISQPGSANTINLISCNYRFLITADDDHGTIKKGDLLNAKLRFETRRVSEYRELNAYHVVGTLTVSDSSGGELVADIRYINISSTPYFVDYVSIDMINSRGNLGNVGKYFDPALITLYTHAGELSDFPFPQDARAFNALNNRRVFQVHTGNSETATYGYVGKFSGGCQ